jgi:hypothetical protein
MGGLFAACATNLTTLIQTAQTTMKCIWAIPPVTCATGFWLTGVRSRDTRQNATAALSAMCAIAIKNYCELNKTQEMHTNARRPNVTGAGAPSISLLNLQ